MKRLLKLFFLPYRKKKLLCESLFFILLIRLSLWLFPYKLLNEWLSQLYSIEDQSRKVDWIVVNSVACSVRACSRFVPRATCLVQALATQTLLGLRKQNSQLKIGVKRDEDDKFMAHAWIEIEGRIIIGKLPYHQHFTTLNSSISVTL